MASIRFGMSICLAMFLASNVVVAQSATATKEGSAAKQGSAAKEGSAAKQGSAAKADAEPQELKLASEKLIFMAPGAWAKVDPRSRILEAELKVAASEEGGQAGRITIMRAGGSIPANIQRWEGQFKNPDGAVEAKTEDVEVEGKPVHFVDISGTFQDSMGRPFAGGKKVSRENYCMSAAIIETGDLGNYFFKFIGPKSVVESNAEAFKKMVRSMKLK